MSEQGGDGGKRNWAVAIVHGVGIAEPIELLDRVTQAVVAARPDLDVESQTTIHHPDKDHIQHERDATLPDGSSVRFATAHWSNVAGFGDGLLDAFGSVMVSGFGVRFLADARPRDGKRDGLLSTALRWVLKGMIFILAVFLPMTLFSLIFSTMGLLAFYLFHDPHTSWQIPFIILSSLTIAMLVAWIGIAKLWNWRREHRLAVPIFGLLVGFAVIGTGLMGLGFKPGRTDGSIPSAITALMNWWGAVSGNAHWTDRVQRLDETAIYFGLFQQLQYIVGFILIGLTVLALLFLLLNAIFSRWDRTRSLGLATISVVTLWVIMLLLLWPENLLTHAAMTAYEKSEPPQATTPFYAITLPKLTLVKIAPDETWRYFPVLWFDLAVVCFMVLALVLVVGLFAVRLGWQALHRNFSPAAFVPPPGKKRAAKSSFPRLVLARPYSALVLALMAAISFIAFTLPGILPELTSWLTATPVQEVGVPADLVKITVIFALVSFALVATSVRLAAKLMLDIVNHFAVRDRNYPLRQKIAARLDHAVERLLRDEDKPHLVIIAHSQGTVITLDSILGGIDHGGLWREPSRVGQLPLKDRVSSLTILTFGSPITHIYQQYFSTLYPDFAGVPRLVAASRDPTLRWYNTYRIDDYIGTYVDNTIAGFPVNVPMPLGGHTNYWDGELFKGLLNRPDLEWLFACAPPAHVRQGH